MMQVSTLYAHSLERQLVSRRSQILQNISRTCAVDQQQQETPQQQQKQQQSSPTENNVDVQSLVNELFLSEAGIIPPEFGEGVGCASQCGECSTHNNGFNFNGPQTGGDYRENTTIPVEVDAKEFTDRLCKLPSQCKGSYILGSPRRHSSSMYTSATRLCQSAGHLNVTSDLSLLKSDLKSPTGKKSVTSGCDTKAPAVSACANDKKVVKKDGKSKGKKEAKNLPSNFMYLGNWYTRNNSEKLLEQVRSGDVLEFNIKFHHHWGIALVNKNKKPTLENLELIHLKKDKEGAQKAVKQTLAEYWIEGVTSRINNSRDVHKQPLSAADVISTSLKIVSQPYRTWQNSEELITHCRYGERGRTRQLSDAARWGTLSKCVGLWLSFTSSRNNSPATSPRIRRKRTLSVNF